MYNPFSLVGKTILVTGASSGIGRTVAIECARLGANIVITGRNIEKLEEVSKLISDNFCKVIPADLTNQEDFNKLIKEINGINGIVHSAGIVKALPAKFITSEFLDEVMNINFKSAVILTTRLVKEKRISKSSSIVFISSISGNLVTSTANSAYCASKAALNGIAKGLALELAPQKIRVNTIMPGIIRTELLLDIPMDEEQMALDMKKYPLGYGEPIDVAHAVIFLLSDASRWMTGSNLLLDGGYTLL